MLLRLDTDPGGAVGDQGKFGAPPEQVTGLARQAAALGLIPYGLAFHVGSQMMDPEAWQNPMRQCAQIMTALAADGTELAMIDVGGGFPVRYDTDPPPLAEYAKTINAAAACLPYPVQLACEPGRAIAAPAGTMVTSVIGTAWRQGTLRVSLDAGAFHGLIEALESGCELRFPVTIPAAGHRTLVPCTLTGPSCDSQDTILDHVWLPMPQAGDRVLIGNTGAYTTCYSGQSAFNGYPAPAVRLSGSSLPATSAAESAAAVVHEGTRQVASLRTGVGPVQGDQGGDADHRVAWPGCPRGCAGSPGTSPSPHCRQLQRIALCGRAGRARRQRAAGHRRRPGDQCRPAAVHHPVHQQPRGCRRRRWPGEWRRAAGMRSSAWPARKG